MFSFLKNLFSQDKLTLTSNSRHDDVKRRWNELIPVVNTVKISQIKSEMFKVPHDDGMYDSSTISKSFRKLLDEGKAPSIDERTLNDIYDTNIKLRTCSCKDWLMSRKNYSFEDPRRLCKHLIHKLDLNSLPEDLRIFRGSMKFFQKRKLGFDRNIYSILMIPGTDKAVVYKKGWCDVTDAEGNRYRMVLHSYKDENIYWYQDKPEDYEIIEEYFQDESFRLPVSLQLSEFRQMKTYFDSTGLDKSFGYELLFNESTPAARIYGLVAGFGEFIGYAKVSNTYICIEFSSYYSDICFERSKMLVKMQLDQIRKKHKQKIQFQHSLENDYDSAKNLLRSSNANFGLVTFYRLLREKNYIVKENNEYAVIGNGLEYALNIHHQVRWNKHKFNTLIEILNNDYDVHRKEKNKYNHNKNNNASKKGRKLQIKKDINGKDLICPVCQSIKVHKKDLRKQKSGNAQRYQCADCGKLILIKVEGNNQLKHSAQ